MLLLSHYNLILAEGKKAILRWLPSYLCNCTILMECFAWMFEILLKPLQCRATLVGDLTRNASSWTNLWGRFPSNAHKLWKHILPFLYPVSSCSMVKIILRNELVGEVNHPRRALTNSFYYGNNFNTLF